MKAYPQKSGRGTLLRLLRIWRCRAPLLSLGHPPQPWPLRAAPLVRAEKRGLPLSNVENYKTTTLITRTFVRVESPCIV
jgi:hypothetical protein